MKFILLDRCARRMEFYESISRCSRVLAAFAGELGAGMPKLESMCFSLDGCLWCLSDC